MIGLIIRFPGFTKIMAIIPTTAATAAAVNIAPYPLAATNAPVNVGATIVAIFVKSA